jgi:putative sigma-54 modulation protein
VNLILSARGVDLDDSLRSYATEKLTRVQRFFDRIIKMEIELLHEKNPRVGNPERVEVTVKTAVQTLRVHGEGTDHFAAIDVATDRLEMQIKKIKERLVDHHNHHKVRSPETVPQDDEDDDGPLISRVNLPIDKPLSMDEARLELESLDLFFLAFIEAETMRPAVLFRRDDGAFGLIDFES